MIILHRAVHAATGSARTEVSYHACFFPFALSLSQGGTYGEASTGNRIRRPRERQLRCLRCVLFISAVNFRGRRRRLNRGEGLYDVVAVARPSGDGPRVPRLECHFLSFDFELGPAFNDEADSFVVALRGRLRLPR